MKNGKLYFTLAVSLVAGGLLVPSFRVSAASSAPSIIYDTQVQRIGWQHDPNDRSSWFHDGQEAGTNGRSLRMESIKIALKLPSGMTGGVSYDAHVQNIGWQNAANPYRQYAPIQTIKPLSQWFANGATAGTVGKGLRMEAFTIQLTGEIAKHYDVKYDSHVQNYGWQYASKGLYFQAPNFETMAPVSDWFKNGQEVGTNDRSLRMEALAIKLVAKPTSTTIKNVTVNKDDKGNTLTSTSGYAKISSSTKSATTSNVYGDKTITNTTTVVWHKPVTTTKNVTVNKDDKGNTLTSTSGYTKVSSSTQSSTVTSTSGDKTITNTTTVVWHKAVVNNVSDLTYTFNDDGTAVVTGFVQQTSDSLVVPSSIINNNKNYKVVEIGDGAFFNDDLASVSLPSTITSIDDAAFASNKISTISFPSGLEHIGGSAFDGNELTSITIPAKLTEIETWAFAVNHLSKVDIPGNITSIGDSAFFDNNLSTVTIANSVVNIGAGAFYWNNLSKVTLPSSIKTIGSEAFQSNQLTSVVVPKSVTYLRSDVFDTGVTITRQ